MAADKREFFAEWSLSECRDCLQQEPAPHQAKALSQLRDWYEERGRNGGAGILVLPTGAGKTFTAVRFLAEGPLSDGYKVLWLAHTHHLLEQAFDCFRANRIGAIREPRRDLKVRVVSGTPGHFPPRDIEPTDDVVIGTLQTITTAVGEELEAMVTFLATAGKKLFIVFDEAHHTPAPSYRRLLQGLQASSASVLGLTATPVYSDTSKQGWLTKLFPDGILAQARAAELMAAGVLARPHAVPRKTRFEPTFESRDYEKWVGSSKDIPDYLIDELANSAERNAFIALEYAENREKYRKTIIFTDRWYQCEAIAEALDKHDEPPGPTRTAKPISSEPDQAVKDEVRARDGQACLACGTRRGLEVDHITAVFVGGSSEAGNLQTLCGVCNRLKKKRKMSFRAARSPLPRAPEALPEPRLPASADAANAEAWERYLRRIVNFFYQCAAVGQVAIGGKGEGYYNWSVTLRSDNPPAWLGPHMKELWARIQGVREAGGKARLASLRLVAPGEKDIVVSDHEGEE